MEKFLTSAKTAAKVLAAKITSDGQLNIEGESRELCGIYKLPTLMLLSGRIKEAHALLDNIKKNHLQENGDFLSYPDKDGRERKSSKFPMSHFWSYMNGWIAMGAHRLGRFDISVPAFEFCKTFYNPEHKMVCVTHSVAEISDDSTMGSLSTAHFGMLCLYIGDLATAKSCGEGLLQLFAKQPDFENAYYTRVNAKTGDVITDIPADLAPFYVIKKNVPSQLYFFLGYHAIFLIKLYLATKESRYLDNAIAMLDFALSCHESICMFSFSHKVMYAAALLGAMTKMAKYRRLAIAIGEYLVSIATEDGLFCAEMDIVDQADQSAEIAIWLLEVHSELKRCA